MPEFEISKIFVTLSNNWQLSLAILSAIVYAAGYLRALLFIHSLGAKTAPTEIYAPVSLFVSGLGTIVASLFIPAIFIIISALTGRLPYRPISLIGGVIYIVLFVLILFCLPTVAKIALPGFLILPDSWRLSQKEYIWIRMITAIILSNLFYLTFICQPVEGTKLYSITYFGSLFLWIALLVSQQYFYGQDIRVGISPGKYSQDPAMEGALITTCRISILGEKQPKFGEEAFSTYGLLLNRKAGAYYFFPGIGAQEQEFIQGFQHSNICIVPEKDVIVFIHIPGVS